MKLTTHTLLAPLAAVLLAAPALHAQDPKAIIAAAVKSELNADRNDHTAFIYRDHDITPEHDTLFLVVETPQGSLKRKLEDHGHPLTSQQRDIEGLRIHGLMNDKNAQRKAARDSANDDAQAEKLLELLPTAFLWTLVSQNGHEITLDFKPDPAFHPTDMESRVLSDMEGQAIIDTAHDRIRTLKGKLVSDVKIAMGLVGRLQQGGTFEVQRREVVPGHWQVTATHVHIAGHAFFKTIGTEEDETRTDFKISTPTTLPQAYDYLEKPNCCTTGPPER